MRACPACNGLGKKLVKTENASTFTDCVDCDGEGWVKDKKYNFIVYYLKSRGIEFNEVPVYKEPVYENETSELVETK